MYKLYVINIYIYEVADYKIYTILIVYEVGVSILLE